MQTLRLTLLLCGVASATAWATPLTWTLHNWAFNDGGTASGTFVYDAGTQTFSAVNVVTTAGSSLGGFNYTAAFYQAAASAPGFVGTNGSSNGLLRASLASSMDDSGGTIALVPGPLGSPGVFGNEYLCEIASCGIVENKFRLLIAGSISAHGIAFSPCDVNHDGNTTVIDAQGIIDQALGTAPPASDLDGDGVVDVVDLEIVINAVLSLGCSATTDSSATAPAITEVVNAANFRGGPIAPGEVVALFGSRLGANGVQVLFDGVPAPVTYAGPMQITCVVPYEIAGKGRSEIQVRYRDRGSLPFRFDVAAANPALFTADGSGIGAAAALNEDESRNAPTNPAAGGSTVALFVTGEGQWLPIAVLVGGQPATVTSYGEAPGAISGVMQLIVRIPLSAPSGDVQVSVSVGGLSSPNVVTLSVK